jgi:hypothetical protein
VSTSTSRDPNKADTTAATKNPAQATAKTNPSKPAAKAAPAQADAAADGQEGEAEAEHPHAPDFLHSRKFLWATSSFGISMILHAVLIIVLALWVITPVVAPKFQEIVATLEERPEELITEVLEQDTTPSQTLSTTSSAASALSVGLVGVEGLTSTEQPQMNVEVTEASTQVKVDVGAVNVFASAGTSLATDVPRGTLGEALAVTESYGDAMDRITQEILNRLARGKVLVIWCFDQSNSMVDDRQEIMARIERVYQELGLAGEATKGEALATAVTSYGNNFVLHTDKPTSDVPTIMQAMNSVPIDETGMERQCEAVGFSIAKHREYCKIGKRQMMFILVTDESGDQNTNFQYLESTIAEAKQANCPIYVLGREAVFGYPFIHYLWTDEKTKEQFWIPIDRGPETPYPEQLQVDGYHRRYDAHPSGFGPYDQARMCRQTGGVFFMLPSVEADIWRRDDRKYEVEAMRGYLPDLSSREAYMTERDKYELRATVWQVILDLNPYDPAKRDVVQVRVDFFPLEPAAFRTEAARNIQKAQVLIGYFQAAEKAMEKVQPLLAREASPRWRANFELVYAQTIGYQLRLHEYIQVLQNFAEKPDPIKNDLGPNRPTTHWELGWRRELVTGDKHKDLLERTTAALQAVIKHHPGTPYAARAEFELNRGWSCRFREEHHHPDRNKVAVPKY